MTEETEINESLYAIYAEAQGHQKPLLQLNLTFARLIDDIVVPYQTNESFFIDGALVTADKLERIKILKIGENYEHYAHQFNTSLTRSDAQTKKTFGEQYSTRFEHILRQNSEDVTSQVLKAFNQVIKPSIKDYLPKREELISAATKIFIESVKALGS